MGVGRGWGGGREGVGRGWGRGGGGGVGRLGGGTPLRFVVPVVCGGVKDDGDAISGPNVAAP